jgi:biopolymer transport protein ExbD
MPKNAVVLAAWLVLTCALGCSGKSEPAPAQEVLGPPLGVLELPVSLRTSDPAPSDARKVEVTMSDIRVDDKLVQKLEGGRVPAADQADGVIPKLKAALQNPARSRIALHAHASLSYETAALVLSSASSAGMQKLSLRVRKSGGSTETGWLAVERFQMTPRTYDEVPLSGVEAHPWDEFAKAWPAMYDACRTSQTASCPYVENNIAQGGNVKVVLFASGSGVNLNFFRVGLSQADLAAEEQKRKAQSASHKEGHKKGSAPKSDLEKELTEGPPASEASFQFRAKEATDPPSTLTAVMQPLCGTKACGAVVSGDSNTLTVRVMSLIGAAFPEGSPVPPLAFEMPWTPKPKAPALVPSEPAPAAPIGK